MPERRRLPEELGEKIGHGSFSRVHVDADPTKVVKESRFGHPPYYWKAQHYLMRVMHELFPESVPLQRAVYIDKNGRAQKIVDRVDTSTDPEHETARQAQMAQSSHREEEIDLEEWNASMAAIQGRPELQALLVRLREAGIVDEIELMDQSGNYVRSPQGATVFVDEWDPHFVDQTKLAAAIEALPEGLSKARAQRGYRRMNELLAELKRS